MLQKFQTDPAIRFATWLSPVLYETYSFIASYLGERLGLSTSLRNGGALTEFARGEVEIGFLCGLLYVQMTREVSCPIELLAAPVLQGERYRDAPLYFSDVIVRRDSPFLSFDDLRGCVWAYNERASHSGCNLVHYSLSQRGEGPDYFGSIVETGAHLQSLQAVLQGKADAAALDSHLLDVLFVQRAELLRALRVVDMLGPSSIPPLVIAKNVDALLKLRIREELLDMHRHPLAAQQLRKGCIKRFVATTDEQYHDIRAMFAQVQHSHLHSAEKARLSQSE